MRVWLAAAVLAMAGQAFAGEYAVLSNGFVLRIERHETAGPLVRLYANGGFTEMPASEVIRFEPEYVPKGTAPATSAAAAPADPEQLIGEAARRHGLPESFVRSVAKVESGFRQDAVSPKGAIGIMQLMPETARSLGADPADPRQNVDAGARYLRELLIRYKDDPYQLRKALAAYNAGPGAVERYNGVPPYRETMKYVERVIKQAGLGK
ncbi:MAG: lytic transglycosylase domain-containing protein [Rhodospirillales bacterium]